MSDAKLRMLDPTVVREPRRKRWLRVIVLLPVVVVALVGLAVLIAWFIGLAGAQYGTH